MEDNATLDVWTDVRPASRREYLLVDECKSGFVEEDEEEIGRRRGNYIPMPRIKLIRCKQRRQRRLPRKRIQCCSLKSFTSGEKSVLLHPNKNEEEEEVGGLLSSISQD